MSVVADTSTIQATADALWEADRSRTPLPPVRDRLGTATDVDVAYAVQHLLTERSVASGRRISGRKIGVTSKAVQAQIGVDQPDYGTLFADTEFGDGVEIPSSRLIQPRAEAEIALVLDRDLDAAPHSFATVLRAVAFVLPAIEIVDSRIENWDIRIVDTIADNASCGLYVLGSRPVPLTAVDVRAVTMSMEVNGAEVSTGTGADCLGNPLHAAQWLADTMSERGTPLRAGDVVMTGALGPMHALATGDEVVTRIDGLGTVTTRLVDE